MSDSVGAHIFLISSCPLSSVSLPFLVGIKWNTRASYPTDANCVNLCGSFIPILNKYKDCLVLWIKDWWNKSSKTRHKRSEKCRSKLLRPKRRERIENYGFITCRKGGGGEGGRMAEKCWRQLSECEEISDKYSIESFIYHYKLISWSWDLRVLSKVTMPQCCLWREMSTAFKFRCQQ